MAANPPPLTPTEPMRCLGCGYIVENLPEPRCPECGRTFDPADPTSFGRRRRVGVRLLVTTLVTGAAMLAPLPLTLVGGAGPVILAAVLIFAGFLFSVALAIAGFELLREPVVLIRDRWAVYAALPVAALLILIWACSYIVLLLSRA